MIILQADCYSKIILLEGEILAIFENILIGTNVLKNSLKEAMFIALSHVVSCILPSSKNLLAVCAMFRVSSNCSERGKTPHKNIKNFSFQVKIDEKILSQFFRSKWSHRVAFNSKELGLITADYHSFSNMEENMLKLAFQ